MRNQIVNTNIKIETLRKALEFFYTVGDKVAIDEIKKILEEVDNIEIEDIKYFDFFKAKNGEPVLYLNPNTRVYEDCLVHISNNAVGFNGGVNISHNNSNFSVESEQLRMK